MSASKNEFDQCGRVTTAVYGAQDQLIVALDFGTTFSGIAYAFANGEKKPEVVSIMEWPGSQGLRQPKTPTHICYDPNDKSSYTWGQQKHAGHVIQGVKLLLEPNDSSRPEYFTKSKIGELNELPKSPTAIAADFMRAAYVHAMSKIESSVLKAYVDTCQKRFVLTVPAAWSDQAKSATQQAARQAGFHDIELIKEPEAAAMYTLHEMADKSLKVGDAFVICDAGGGTVDLISYEIIQLKPLLLLKELVPSTGKTCGSLGLNLRFTDAVKKTVGIDQFYNLEKMRNPSVLDVAVRQFDTTVKRDFDGDADEEYYINFPMADLKPDPRKNLYAGCWNMKGSDVAAIFKPLIDDIVLLVGEQVDKVEIKRLEAQHDESGEIKAIFLVGGFGTSEYLKTQLEQHFPKISVVQPHDGWAAIVKGAVLSKLPHTASIVSVQATRHYGVAAQSPYKRKDRGQPRIRDPSTGEDKIHLRRDETIKFGFFRTLRANYTLDELVFKSRLVESSADEPPRYPDRRLTRTNCTLTTNLKDVDRSLFATRSGVDGKYYVDIHYDLVVTIKPAVMVFSLEVDGNPMGAVEADYH
ncbi:Hsp70 family protein-like protein [Halenospora varia]|nr:Hsp70 family protein-like protein [Halenospora varia]